MDCKLKTVTPLFIGSGNKLVPFEYTIDAFNYSRLNLNRIFDLIYNIDPLLIDKFNTWVDKTSKELDNERSYEKQSEIRRRFKIKNFMIENKIPRESIDRIFKDKESTHYCFTSSGIIGKHKELNEIQKKHDNTPFIPGSSIKGSIRTALAYNALLNFSRDDLLSLTNGIPGSDIKGLLKELNDEKTKEKYFGQDIENIIFYLGRKINDKIIFKDEKFDLLKALKITDTYEQEAEFDLFNITIFKKSIDRDRKQPSTQSSTLMEVIREDGIFKFNIEIDIEYLRKLQNLNDITRFEEKIKKTFGITLNELNSGNVQDKIIKYLKESLSKFAKKNIERELKWLDSNPNKVDIIQKEYSKLSKMQSEDKILTRIGFGSGFFQTTVGLAMLDNDSLKKQLSNVFNKFKIGIPPNLKRDYHNNQHIIDFDKFPTSRRLLESNFKPIFPLGWVELEF
jgi:CRISPR-associated protein Csm5